MNEPVPVTITVESTEEDKQGLKVSLWFSDPDIQVDGEDIWVVNLKAHTSIQFSTTIRFTEDGHFTVYAGALDYQHGRMVIDSIPIQITLMGGTLNPPSRLTPGVPEPVTTIEVTPLSPLPTPAPETPQPEEQPDETLGPTPTPSPIIVVVNQEVNVPIPDDSTWLTFTIPITTAPSGVTVVGAHAKFLVVHPRGEDLVAEVIGPDGATGTECGIASDPLRGTLAMRDAWYRVRPTSPSSTGNRSTATGRCVSATRGAAKPERCSLLPWR